MISLLDNRFVNRLIHMQNCIAHILYYIYSDCFFVHCTALTKPVTYCKRSSSSSFSETPPQFHVCLLRCRSALSHTEICKQLDFIVIIAGRLILIVWRIFTGISQTIRYRPSLDVTCHHKSLKILWETLIALWFFFPSEILCTIVLCIYIFKA